MVIPLDSASEHPGLFVYDEMADSRWTAAHGVLCAALGDMLKVCGLRPESCEVSLSLVSAEHMTALNSRHRGRAAVTDVLSFPMLRWARPLQRGSCAGLPLGDFLAPDEFCNPEHVCLGDIVICPEVAAEQASRLSQPLGREVAFLLIHGFLHLVGHDHHDAAEEALMRDQQQILLQVLMGAPYWEELVRAGV